MPVAIPIALLLASAPPPAGFVPLSPAPARRLRTLARHPDGYGPGRARRSLDLVLGDLLYHSPEILGAKAGGLGVSCDTCHPNGAAHRSLAVPGLSDRPGNVDLTSDFFHPHDDGEADAINIPSLRGARYTAPYGHDGRIQSLDRFIAQVVTDELGGPPLADRALSALTRYVSELDFLPNRLLDRRGRLRRTASAAAHRGESIFFRRFRGLDGRACADCHVPSAYFRDGLIHRHQTARAAGPDAFDDGVETPTLLGLAETAPYFHDGRHARLEDVVTWYDRTFALELGPDGARDLTAYLSAVGAVTPSADDRPLAIRLADRFVYLVLVGDDAPICRLAIARVMEAIASEAPAPEVAARIEGARARLTSMSARCGTPSAGPQAERLHVDLLRLAADWSGARARTALSSTAASR